MVHIVGAGPGAEDLITVRGLRLLKQADIVIYAGSLVNPGLLKETKQGAVIYDSAKMTLEQVMEVIEQAWKEQKEVVRLHTGDPCLYSFYNYRYVPCLEGTYRKQYHCKLIPAIILFLVYSVFILLSRNKVQTTVLPLFSGLLPFLHTVLKILLP